jgi:hypothetical protein
MQKTVCSDDDDDGEYTQNYVHSRKQKLAALYMPMAGQAVQLLT